MVATKEAISPGLDLRGEELIKGSQNSFLGFIEENKGLFQIHTSCTHDLKNEEEGFKNSPMLEQLIKDSVELFVSATSARFNAKKLRKASGITRRALSEFIFSGTDDKAAIINNKALFFIGKRVVNNKTEAAVNDLADRTLEFMESYQKAKSPIVSELQKSRAELSAKLKDFLLSEPLNLFAFQRFLEDRDYAFGREDIRPFLASFAQSEDRSAKDNREGVLSETVKTWATRLKEKPTQEVFDEFSVSIESPDKSPEILEWLIFAIQKETPTSKDISDFLKSREISKWPSRLRKEFNAFIASKFSIALGIIRKELDQFRKPLNLKVLNRDYGLLEREVEKVEESKDNSQDKKEVLKKKKYPIGFLSREIGEPTGIKLLTEDELNVFLEKQANSLAQSDKRVLEDLGQIFASLQEDPFTLGVRKLTGKFVRFRDKTIPLRRLDPRRRAEVSLSHPESSRIRIVYAIFKSNGQSAIGIEGVYSHEEFDKKFGS